MSLISEALKEAQREHSVRKGRPSSVALVDNFFPYPTSKKRGRPNTALLVGGAALIVLAGAGAAYARFRLKPTPARLAAPVTAPPISSRFIPNRRCCWSRAAG